MWRDYDLYLGRIEVRPDLQGSGIGTRVLRHLAAKAARNSKPLVLEVIDVNPARRLYERLGFEPFKTVGRKIHLRMNTAAIDLSEVAEINRISCGGPGSEGFYWFVETITSRAVVEANQ